MGDRLFNGILVEGVGHDAVGNLQIDAYLAEPPSPQHGNDRSAQPPQADRHPAIIVIQEIFGVNSHIRDVTDRFAKLGYVAIAPAIYQRIAPGFETGYTPEDIQLGRKYKEQTRVDELLSDIRSTIAYLSAKPNVDPDAIGCIGFCFGGLVVYLAATLPEIKATASFYGAGISNWSPGIGESSGKPTIAYTPEIKGTLYGFFGMEDPSIPPDHVDQIEAALQQSTIPHRIFRYANAQHGFFCDQRSSYQPEAAADAWNRVQELFSSVLDNHAKA
ncbi:dienelactone hydrolase family protein [Leptolyngbya ohadii]|uniref:dienelactone hydrolase family protein n=1 Tax=Leptolyngbya ohadii TaxID=1962290 RepID=UPI0034E1A476